MAVNFKLRNALYSKWATMQDAAREIGIDAASISLLVRNRREPTLCQRRKLRQYFSAYQLRQMFRRNVATKFQGAEAASDR